MTSRLVSVPIIASVLLVGVSYVLSAGPSFAVYALGALGVFVSLFLPGYVLLDLLTKTFTVEERIALSFFVTIPGYSLAVLLGALFSAPWYVLAVADFSLVAVSLVFFVRRRLYRGLMHADLLGIEATLIVFVFSLLFVALPFQTASLSVSMKIQSFVHTADPDNYLPYRVAQFVVNHLDPRRQEFLADWTIADRTPLMGLAAAFFLQVYHVNVPSGILWTLPTVVQGNSYQFFQIIGSFLNSLIMLGAYTFLKEEFNRKTGAVTTVLLLLNSFVLLNISYTWPKNLAAYFVLISYYLLLKRRPFWSGFAGALAFLSHPIGAMYLLGAFAYAIHKKVGRAFLFSSTVTTLPWFLWSLLVVGIPRFLYYPFFLSSHVAAVNQPGQVVEEFLRTPLWLVFWNRMVTAYDILAPSLLSTPVDSGASAVNVLAQTTIFTLAGALGLPMFLFCYYGFAKSFRALGKELTCFVIVPFLVFLAEIGGAFDPTWLSAWHALQPLVPILLGLGVASFINRLKPLIIISVSYAIQNFLVLWMWSYPFPAAIQAWSRDPVILMLAMVYYALLAVWSASHLLPRLRIRLPQTKCP